MSVSFEFARPHQAFTAGFYRDAEFDATVRSLLGHAPAGAAEPGEVLATIAGIRDGDREAWFGAWRELGSRLAALGDELRAAERFDSASGAYLRAARYLSVAVNAAPDDAVLETFRAHRAAWDGFIDTTVYLAERVEIPYEGTTLPGYLLLPADDDEPRPTVIVNNGSDASHAEAWGDAAIGALTRGYTVLLFDGPGQQSMLFERGVPFRHDWEAVLTPVIDFVAASDDVDAARIGVVGLSQAGYWVARALAFESRPAAAILDPGVVDVSASWLPHLPGPLRATFEAGKQQTFDRDMELGMRFDRSTARTWSFRARPYGQDGPFATLTEVLRYRLDDELLGRIATPLFVTSPEREQFWPGQSQRLADAVRVEHQLQPFTAAEGADGHCQPLARMLTQQRMYDWLDDRLTPQA